MVNISKVVNVTATKIVEPVTKKFRILHDSGYGLGESNGHIVEGEYMPVSLEKAIIQDGLVAVHYDEIFKSFPNIDDVTKGALSNRAYPYLVFYSPDSVDHYNIKERDIEIVEVTV